MFTLYVWIRVRFLIYRKVSHDYVLAREKKELNLRNITIPFSTAFQKSYAKINTRFGDLDLYRFGTSRKIVVFVNGLLSNSRSAARVWNFWKSRGYSVICYDNFGWGDSRKFGKTTLGKKESDLLKDVINYVQKNSSPLDLIVYGESMGGATVYAYLGKYGNQGVRKFIVDAGYFSFFGNLMTLVKKRLSIFSYLFYLPLICLSFIQRWPIKKFIKAEELKKINNVYHLQSLSDKLVTYSHVKKMLPNLKHHVYKNPNVRHVLGWYDAIQEHEDILDQWINEN